MSTQSQLANYIQALEQNNLSVAINYAAFALLLYDYLLNFSREVELIWQQKFRLLSFLYILNYYPVILSWLLSIILNSYTPQCSTILQVLNSVGTLSVLANTAFQITRTSAICGKSWVVAISLALLNLPLIILSFWTTVISNCVNNFAPASLPRYETVANIIGLLFAISVVILTILKTFQASREHKQLHMVNNHNLAGLILANGSLYFIIIFLFKLLAIIFYFHGSVSLQNIGHGVSDFLGTIIISRFMLKLREKTVNPNGTNSAQLPNISSLHMVVNHMHSIIEEDFGTPLHLTSYDLRQASMDNVEDVALEDVDTTSAVFTLSAGQDAV